MRSLATITLLVIAHSICTAQTPIYKNKKASTEGRVEDLLKRMTLEEKILQLNQGTVGDNNNPNNKGFEKPSFAPGLVR